MNTYSLYAYQTVDVVASHEFPQEAEAYSSERCDWIELFLLTECISQVIYLAVSASQNWIGDNYYFRVLTLFLYALFRFRGTGRPHWDGCTTWIFLREIAPRSVWRFFLTQEKIYVIAIEVFFLLPTLTSKTNTVSVQTVMWESVIQSHPLNVRPGQTNMKFKCISPCSNRSQPKRGKYS